MNIHEPSLTFYENSRLKYLAELVQFMAFNDNIRYKLNREKFTNNFSIILVFQNQLLFLALFKLIKMLIRLYIRKTRILSFHSLICQSFQLNNSHYSDTH